MLKRTHLSAALIVCAALWPATGCTPPPAPANPSAPSSPKIAPGSPTADTGSQGQDMADTAPVGEGIVQAIKKHASLFPKGVTLDSVSVRGGVAALDFSPEFSQLANMGDTTESRAQKQLRAALAKFSAIRKMTVTVHGRPFDSQTADWTTPFPVRLSVEEKDAAESQDPAAADAARPEGGGR